MRHSNARIDRRLCRGRWLLLFCAVPLAAHANAMIPYMLVPWGQVFLLPLVIIIEGVILRGFLGGRTLVVMLQSVVANVASTVVGAALYMSGMPMIGEPLFAWWFKGAFGSEGVRGALISLSFAAILWLISWLVEGLILSRMRKVSFSIVAKPCAVANAATYGLLLALALWFGK